ncbi:MAG: hypothetical protein SAJ12_04085 [Jaaginema sp. PMC 1079.18]|nr:hypothetical protein [Jaaginema sp. PMC 1080.18]MEC4850168.1 hypothetical protein [Jaaginema sp. PMC 1079.18]MEC4865101.1 hypothetical protein [Jaaginema sp. PMC 1078.18]
MRLIFADTFYWIALINQKDDWHERVILFTSTLDQVEIVTTDEVLTEVLNFTHDKHFKQEGFIVLFQD